MFGVEHRLARLEFLEQCPAGTDCGDRSGSFGSEDIPTRHEPNRGAGAGGYEQEALSALNVAQDITSYFDFTQYEIAVLETKEYNGVKEYSLEVRTEESEALHIRVTDDTWFPTQIIVFEDGVQAGEMTFNNVTFSPGLEREDFQNLPKVKEVRL